MELMQQLWDTLREAATGYLPRLAGALAILIGFWLFALILAAVVRAALRRTELDNKVFRWMVGEEDVAKVQSEKWVSRGVFYVVMLFGLVAFFNTLGLLMVTDPLNRMLGSVFEFAPRILSAGLLLLLALVVARLVRFALTRVLKMVRLDERLGEVPTMETDAGQVVVSRSIATAMYWLVLLLFLPMALDALALRGLLQPLQGMLEQFLGFLPNLFAAILILVLGWLAARIVRQVVSNLLAAAGVDRFGETAGLGTVLGSQTLSGLVGALLYALILIPVAIAALDALQLGGISEPAGNMLGTILETIPAVLTAGVIVLIAYLVGRFAAGLVQELLARLGFDGVLSLLGLGTEIPAGRPRPSEIVGTVVLVATLFFACIEAARSLGLEALAALLIQFAQFAGHVLLGLVILGVGLYVSNLVAGIIAAGRPRERGLLATAARVAILILAAAMALKEMGLADEIINMAFALVFGTIAVAAALAFGLGSRDIAAREVDQWIGAVRKMTGRGGE